MLSLAKTGSFSVTRSSSIKRFSTAGSGTSLSAVICCKMRFSSGTSHPLSWWFQPFLLLDFEYYYLVYNIGYDYKLGNTMK